MSLETHYIVINADKEDASERLKSFEKILIKFGAVVLDADVSEYKCVLRFSADLCTFNSILVYIGTLERDAVVI